MTNILIALLLMACQSRPDLMLVNRKNPDSVSFYYHLSRSLSIPEHINLKICHSSLPGSEELSSINRSNYKFITQKYKVSLECCIKTECFKKDFYTNITKLSYPNKIIKKNSINYNYQLEYQIQDWLNNNCQN